VAKTGTGHNYSVSSVDASLDETSLPSHGLNNNH
jgi:hypothetical protein